MKKNKKIQKFFHEVLMGLMGGLAIILIFGGLFVVPCIIMTDKPFMLTFGVFLICDVLGVICLGIYVNWINYIYKEENKKGGEK
ncbi:MAG: hypothetical protein WC499_03820 [Patescibacteria group bacterium]|jgi:hypothetical protein